MDWGFDEDTNACLDVIMLYDDDDEDEPEDDGPGLFGLIFDLIFGQKNLRKTKVYTYGNGKKVFF